MDENRKRAYRYLLYDGVLEIRNRSITYAFWRQRWNPFFWNRRAEGLIISGRLADWLENLAHFSADDFANFDEEWFWRGWESVKHGGAPYMDYRVQFERYVAAPPRPQGSWHKTRLRCIAYRMKRLF